MGKGMDIPVDNQLVLFQGLDILVEETPQDAIGKTDTVLDAALARLRKTR